MGGASTRSRSCRAAPGSGLSGGSSAVDGGIVLSLERMRAIEIDTDCRVAVVEPGAFNAEVKAAAAEHGLWYPPDPSSYEICSIGGNVATNAGGLCCVKYGVTTDYVLGLDVVLADGTLVTLGGKRIKDVAGLSLLKLFVGSEGTLGIVTRAILRLVPDAGGALDAGRDVRRRRRGGPGRGRGRPVDPPVDDGADGPRLDQRRRGLPADGAGPRRRRAAGRAVGRPRGRPRPGGRGDAEGLRRPPARPRCSSPTTPTRARCSSRRGGPAFPAIEARGTLLLEDVGAPIPLLPELLAAISAIADEVRHRDPGRRARRRRQHPPDHRVRRGRPGLGGAGAAGVRRGHARGDRPRRHHHRRARRRPHQEGARCPDQLGPDVMALTRRVKDALDPRRDPQPRGDPLTGALSSGA